MTAGKFLIVFARNVECYFCNPETGETGWDIKFIDIKGYNLEDAIQRAKNLPHFDCFIDYKFDKYNDDVLILKKKK